MRDAGRGALTEAQGVRSGCRWALRKRCSLQQVSVLKAPDPVVELDGQGIRLDVEKAPSPVGVGSQGPINRLHTVGVVQTCTPTTDQLRWSRFHFDEFGRVVMACHIEVASSRKKRGHSIPESPPYRMPTTAHDRMMAEGHHPSGCRGG